MTIPSAPLPLTDRSKRAFKIAHKEQQAFRHPVVAAEHVLLGLIDDKRSLASFVLRELKVDIHALEDGLRAELKKGAPVQIVSDLALLGAAPKWVADLKQVSIGTEHLLLAIIDSASAAGRLLAEAGISLAKARDMTESLLGKVQRGSGPTALPEE